MAPICTNAGLTFTAQSNAGTAGGTNNYGCLYSQPNPSWYYFEVSTAGNIDMVLSAPSDIDYIIWGPFPDLATAQGECGNMGNGGSGQNVVDCSYSYVSTEYPSITNAQVGEVYVMLITNYANNVQNLTLTQSGGTGATDCSIIPPCQSSAGTFSFYKNGNAISANNGIILCPNDEVEINTNSDYVLPNDTLAGNFESALMFMLYDQVPSNPDPGADPGFLGTYFPDSIFNDINNPASPIVSGPGYGTYYLVPVSGDDGVYNGNPNGGINYDKDGNGCFDLGDEIQITYIPPITITDVISCDGTLAGNGVDFTINGGTPQLSGGNYSVISLENGNVTPNTTGLGGTVSVNGLSNNSIVQIQVTDANGCTDSTLEITFVTPQFNINTTPATNCGSSAIDNGAADVVVTNGSGNGPGYAITLNGTTTNGATANVSSLSAGTNINVIVTDVEGCATQNNATVGSSGVSIEEVTGSVNVQNLSCGGANDGSISVNYEITGTTTVNFATFTWTGPNGVPNTEAGAVGQNTFSFNPTNLEAGSYVVVIEADNGCVFNFQYNLTEPNALVVDLVSFSQPKCFNGDDGSVDINVNGGSSPYSIVWSGSTSSSSEDLDQLEAGTYTVTVTDNNGCTGTLTQVIDNPAPFTAEVLLKDPTCNGYEDGSAVVSNVQGNQGVLTYVWSTDNPNPNSVGAVNNLKPGTHTVQVFDENSCSAIIEFTIDEVPPFVINNLDSTASKCRSNGLYPGTGQVSANIGGSNGGVSIQWTGNGDTTNTPTWGNRTPGLYTYVATDVKGCVLTGTVYVDSINPVADFTAEPMQGIAPLDVDFTNTSTGISQNNASYSWNPGFGSFNSTEIFTYAPDTTYTEGGTYTVVLIVTNEYGCKDSTSKEIVVYTPLEYTAPNVFTPNGDGVNDYLYISGEGITEEGYNMVIFNRWGEKVFETNLPGQTNGWNGTNAKGKELPEGVYQYVFTLKSEAGEDVDGQGFFHMLREK